MRESRLRDRRQSGQRRRAHPGAPDIAVCGDCLREMRDPADRRYQHPFITCTNCGPRYTVITDLPMTGRPPPWRGSACARPARSSTAIPPIAATTHRPSPAATADRGCPGAGGRFVCAVDDPIGAAVEALLSGRIVAVKGIGGYHLACRADDTAAVATLRARKNRPAKPFAVMVADLAAAGAVAEIDARRRGGADIPGSTDSPGPASQWIAQRRRGAGPRRPGGDAGLFTGAPPAVRPVGARATGDDIGQPRWLADCVPRRGPGLDCRLRRRKSDAGPGRCGAHPRPADRVPCEDSVVTIDDRGGQLPLRRSRGYAPCRRRSTCPGPRSSWRRRRSQNHLLSDGGAGPDGRRDAHLSSHLGDMADPRTQVCFSGAGALGVHDRSTPGGHRLRSAPGYATSAWARRYAGGRPVLAIQHHHAHAVSLLADHRRLGTPMVALTYDGTGYGTDGTVWGGEVLTLGRTPPSSAGPGTWRRSHSPEPRAHCGSRLVSPWTCSSVPVSSGLPICRRSPRSARRTAGAGPADPARVGCAPTTSMGRLFDAIASLLGSANRSATRARPPSSWRAWPDVAVLPLSTSPWTAR